MSYETRKFGKLVCSAAAWLRSRRSSCCVAACSGDGDGSVGIGTGQDPDPVAPDFPIAYTKGPLLDEDEELQVEHRPARHTAFRGRHRSLHARSRITDGARAQRDRAIHGRSRRRQGVEISTDGRRILFAMRGPVDEGLALDDPDQPTWNIWEYVIATDTLRRLIVNDITAQQGHDISPHYLPDGRIVFASTRQQTAKAILINDNKPQYDARDEDRQEPAFVLHVMRDDGRDDFKQVSFNQSSDYEPTRARQRQGAVQPVGSRRQRQRHQPVSDEPGRHGARAPVRSRKPPHRHEQRRRPVRQRARDGRRPDHDDPAAVRSSRARRRDHDHRHADLRREHAADRRAPPAWRGLRRRRRRRTKCAPICEPSTGGRFSSAFPLWDGTGRVLTTWSICRLEEPDPANPTIRPRSFSCRARPSVSRRRIRRPSWRRRSTACGCTTRRRELSSRS